MGSTPYLGHSESAGQHPSGLVRPRGDTTHDSHFAVATRTPAHPWRVMPSQPRCIWHMLEAKRLHPLLHLRLSPSLRSLVSEASEFALTRDGIWVPSPLMARSDPADYLLLRPGTHTRLGEAHGKGHGEAHGEGKYGRNIPIPTVEGSRGSIGVAEGSFVRLAPPLIALFLNKLAQCIDLGGSPVTVANVREKGGWCTTQRRAGQCHKNESIRLMCARTCEPACSTILQPFRLAEKIAFRHRLG